MCVCACVQFSWCHKRTAPVGDGFKWRDALNLESRLTEDEIIMRYVTIAVY